MGNQAIPVIDSVQGFTFEKVILSGSPFVSAILGPGSYVITAPFTPLFHRDPIISGYVVPPSTLTCEAQSFSSSPRATITYQWKRDTVNISNEINDTYVTVVGDIGLSITCEATITNASGADIALSNVIIPEAVVEGYVYQHDVMSIQGLGAPGRMDMNELQLLIVTGLSHVDKVDVNEAEVYGITGMQGLNNMTTAELEIMPIFLPEFVANLVVVNGDAENSNMSDWTMDSGGVTSVTDAPAFDADITTYREGLRFFKPDDLGQGVDSQMSQVIAIAGGDEAAVDTGRCYALAKWIHQSEEGIDRIHVTMKALNAASGELNSEITISPENPEGGFNGNTKGWKMDTSVNEILRLPTLTRFVKIVVLFKASGSGSAACSSYADAFTIELLKA